jgi:hypothetical protein
MGPSISQEAAVVAKKPDSGGAAAVMERPNMTQATDDGLTSIGKLTVDYLGDAKGIPKGANVNLALETGPTWQATIRWKDDLAAGHGGHYRMTYPNPGGGDDYEVDGRQQLQPLVDQAMRIGTERTFGGTFST